MRGCIPATLMVAVSAPSRMETGALANSHALFLKLRRRPARTRPVHVTLPPQSLPLSPSMRLCLLEVVGLGVGRLSPPPPRLTYPLVRREVETLALGAAVRGGRGGGVLRLAVGVARRTTCSPISCQPAAAAAIARACLFAPQARVVGGTQDEKVNCDLGGGSEVANPAVASLTHAASARTAWNEGVPW